MHTIRPKGEIYCLFEFCATWADKPEPIVILTLDVGVAFTKQL